jgi:DNA topoisomerase-1
MAKTNKSGKTLVVVESPTKAKTIRKFLGKDYIVESCMGHVRDLPQTAKDIPEKIKKQPWGNLGVNVDNDFEPVYCVPKNKTKIVKLLKEKLEEADNLILATDEDREGESISWHLLETLKPKVPYTRMVFHEITKSAIERALNETREIDFNLVRAQEARRVLDRLVGYTISPLLWKKVAFGLSAGRVQSVAVRLIVEREQERLRFKKSVYWGVQGENSKDDIGFESRLVSFNGKRVATGKDFDSTNGQLIKDKASEILHLDGKAAQDIKVQTEKQKWLVSEVEEKPVSRKPPAPFITSTLQQESNRKLGLSARETMQVAQNLYEQGWITYMRTDSTFLSKEALQATRSRIQKLYGKEYLPDEARSYEGKKVKGAQEAHEAIRPAGTEFLTPDETGLSGPQLRLYELIWKRTMASQMVNARQKQVGVRFEVGEALFSASGMTIEFPGFLRAYVEGNDDENAALEEREVRLPQLNKGDVVQCHRVLTTEHETKPPARYTEASLVQTMEKEGIGRPSTYAAVISTIIDRGYVKKMGNALSPTFTAMVVANLLSQHLPQYVDLGFTSNMEKSLDDIAEGDLDWVKYLKTIYFGEKGLKSQVDLQTEKINADEARAISLEGLKGLSFRVGRYGAYVCRTDKGEEVCASLPEAQAPADITFEIVNKLIDQKINGTDALGKDPKTGLLVYVLTGRYGPYVQLGESAGEEAKPKRMSIPPGVVPEQIKLEQALELLELPKLLGTHPGTGKEIKAGLGRFGPYIVHDGDFRSIPKSDNLFSIELPRALEIIMQPKKGRGKSAPLKDLGKYPGTEELVLVYTGKFGPYVKCGKTNVSLPDGLTPENVTAEQAIDLLKAKGVEFEAPAKAAKAPKEVKVAKALKKPKLAVAKPAPKVSSAQALSAQKAKALPKAGSSVIKATSASAVQAKAPLKKAVAITVKSVQK